jgi:hypothetical protein
MYINSQTLNLPFKPLVCSMCVCMVGERAEGRKIEGLGHEYHYRAFLYMSHPLYIRVSRFLMKILFLIPVTLR